MKSLGGVTGAVGWPFGDALYRNCADFVGVEKGSEGSIAGDGGRAGPGRSMP